MVDFQEMGVIAARSLAFAAGSGQNKAAGGWWYGGCIAFIGTADLAVALGMCKFCFADFQFAFAGLNSGFFALGALMDVQLHGWFVCCLEVPPGGPFCGIRTHDFEQRFDLVGWGVSLFADLLPKSFITGELSGRHFQIDVNGHYCGWAFFWFWGKQ